MLLTRPFKPSAATLRLLSVAALLGSLSGGCRQTVVLDALGDGGGSSGQGGLGPDGGGAGGQGGFGDGCEKLGATLRLPDVVLSLDRSTAMQAPLDGSSTRHEAARLRLQALVQMYQNVIRFGYQELPTVGPTCGPNGTGTCCSGEVFGPSPFNSLAFGTGIHACNANFPCLSAERPVAAALQRSRQRYTSSGNSNNHNRYVVLVTGGEPACAGASGPGGPGSRSACLDAQDEAFALVSNDVPTIVVAVGSQLASNDCLDMLAMAGSLDRAMSPFYYLAGNASDLSDTLSSIVAGIAKDACHIDLQNVRQNDRDRISVFLDGDEIPHNGVNGWEFDNSGSFKITLHGDACQALIGGQADLEVGTGNCSGF